jgi:tRNA pseudouridine38-40 synthase
VIHYYKLVLEYKGTPYLGWQIQPEGSGKTVQGELNRSLRAISKSEDVKSLGAGRTDAGVHALGQVVKVAIPLEIVPLSLMRALNSHLPDDIRVLSAELSTEEFIPTYHAKSKEYHYRFTINRNHAALQSDLIANQSFELDLEKMQKACKVLVGEHDFTNFFCEGTEVASNIRRIYECEILEVPQDGWMLPSHYVFRIVGNGFLKQMVRLLMGAVWNIGRGKISIEDLQNALGPEKVQKLGAVAPPNGLYMVRVNY